MAAAKSVLCLGEVLIDIIVSDGAQSLESANSFIARPGGAPANVAVALQRLGVRSEFCGAIGDDPFGARLKSALRADEVGIEHLAVIPGQSTTLAFAWKDQRGDGQFRIIRLADALLSTEIVERARIPDCRAIIVGSVALTEPASRDAIYRAINLAAAEAVPVCFDVNMRASLWKSSEQARSACRPVLERTTILKLSVDDAGILLDLRDPEEIFASQKESGTILLLTDGARGAWFRNASGEVEHVPAFEIKPVEPTGAGDAFTAGIVARFLTTGRPPNRQDVEFASAAGAITATRVGAIESLPTHAEVDAFLNEH
jgi:fructokinase